MSEKKIMDADAFLDFCKNFVFHIQDKQSKNLASSKVLNEIFKRVNKNDNK